MGPKHATSVFEDKKRQGLEEARRVIRGLGAISDVEYPGAALSGGNRIAGLAVRAALGGPAEADKQAPASSAHPDSFTAPSGPGAKRRAAGIEAGVTDVTVIVKTFERPACVAMCLASVRDFYPKVPILVCDDGREPLFANEEQPAPGIRWLTLPFEAGHTLGAGRNHLLRNLTTPFFFLADDDHAFTAHTRLDLLAGVLHRHSLDIVGGAQDRGDYGGAIFERKGDLVYQRFHEYHEELEAGVVRCDRISNTFLARTEAVRNIGWEERVHGSEHADFFLRASGAGLRIAQVGYVFVDHRRDCETPTGWMGRLFGRWLPHRDRAYAWLRRGKDQAGANWAEREQEFVHKKNRIRAIVDVQNRALRRELEARIGTPYYEQPPFC
jgi:GT2 family glycosyltransferase